MVLLDGPALAAEIGRPEQTLRAWAAAGVIERRGRDRRGRTLYDLDEVLAVSTARRRRSAPRPTLGTEVTPR